MPIKRPEEEFDFVDGSSLALRRFGLFSPSYDYFYFEDVDLCLRYGQMGLQIALLDAPYESRSILATGAKLYTAYLIARPREWFEKHMANCLRSAGGQIWIERAIAARTM